MKEDSVDVAGRKLKEVHSQYQEKSKEFDRLYEAFTKTSQVKPNFDLTLTFHSDGLQCLCKDQSINTL